MKYPNKKQRIARASKSICPFCKSADCTYDDTEFSGGRVTQEGFCRDCGKEWREIYEMVQVLEWVMNNE